MNILKKEDGPGNNALSQEGNTTLMSFKDMFEDVSGSRAPKSPTFLLGKAGDGKSTFCKYLTNAWACPNGSTQQFLDANVLEQFKYLFFVSCRFAKEEESIFDMIENQLFCQKDVSMKRTAKHMLEHRPELCLIVVDGLDEWKGSATSDTGRPEDIEGLPSFNGVEKCTLFITSRHWRFYALEEHIRTQSIQLVIDGLRNEAQLVEHTLQLLNDPEPKQSRDAFLLQIEENDMTELKESPLMLIMAIDLWKNEGSLCKSLCMNYVKIVRSFIYRAEGQSGWPTTEKRVSVPINYSENDPSFIKWPSCFSVSKQYHSLLLLLGHLAFDHLIGRKEQSLVFSKDECQSYLYDEGDEKINVCLALGILSKTATTVLGIEKIETYSFPHKMFQEFFAAMWLAIKYTDEKSKLYQTIRTMESVFECEILIRFLCGLNPEAGKEFWIYVTKKDIGADPLNLYEYDPRDDNIYKSIQTLILQSVKESRNCSGKEAEHIYYQLPVIWIDGKTSEEEKTVIFNTMEHYNETQYLHSSMLNANYQSMLSSVSHALFIQVLRLGNISSSNDCLDLQHHGMLKLLILDDLPIRDLKLPSEGSQLRVLKLWGLALSHTSMEHLYSSISSSSYLKSLELIRLACHDNSCRDTWSLSVLDLTYRHGLHELKLDQLPISNLILPKDMELKLSCMTLCDLNLSHKSLEQLCSSISCLSNLNKLILSNLCRDHSCSDTCCSIVLDLKPHQVLSYLKLCQIPISDLILRSNDHSQLENLKLCDLTLTHKSIEQFSISLWGPSVLECLEVTNWSCRDHSCSTACCLSVLDLQFNNNLMELTLDKLPISELKIPCDEDSNLGFLSLYDISLTHKSLEELCSDLNFPEALVSVDLLNLSCRDHSSSDTCSLPELDLQNQYNLSNLRLFNIPVEGLLLPNAMTDTVIDLRFANMKVDGWRNFIDALAVTEIDNVVIVILTSCNIDSDTRKIISNSPQFCVTHDDDSLVEFEVVKSGTHSESENDTDNGWMAIEILNSDTH